MAMRQTFGRQASKAIRPQKALPGSRRGLAAPASGSFAYQQGDASGVKFASRDMAGPTTTLALVARAGTRYQPLPGLAEGLEKFAFRNTSNRSALRLQREAELMGATYFSHHSRESIVIGAKFFRDDLPYFVEALAEVASSTKYLDYEFREHVVELIHKSQKKVLGDTKELALTSAHGTAFHRGLGEPLLPTSSTPLDKYLSHDAIGAYSTLAYRKSNIALVANGAEQSELSKWTNQYFGSIRSEAASGIPPLKTEQTKYFGGEERIAHGGGNTMVLAFPGSSSLTGGFYKPELAVLATLLGGKSTIKWSPGFSLLGQVAGNNPGVDITTSSAIYSDAGLLYTTLHGSATAVRDAAHEVVKAIQNLAGGKIDKEAFEKARALAKFKELEYGQVPMAALELTGAGLVQDGKPYQLDESAQKIGEVTIEKVQEAAKTLLEYKATVASVGDLWQLPYAQDLGLQV